MRRFVIGITVVIVLTVCGFLSEVTLTYASLLDLEDRETSEYRKTPEESPDVPDTELRSYLFIHDTSVNMRRKNRISIMQTSIRAILDSIPLASYAGLRAFGHRFPLGGPDMCDDTDMVVPMERLTISREDFENQLNLLADPPIGGGAPVGLALKRGITDLQSFEGQKEVYLYLVDLQKCEDDNPIDTIKSACQVNDLHLTLVGFGLKSDMRALNRNNIQRLGCVDVINILTREEAEVLPDKLLTRFSLVFKNAEGQLVDPSPGDNLMLQLYHKDQEGKLRKVRQKVKDIAVKGTSIDTVGLDEGTYVMELSYEGQKLRTQQEIFVKTRQESREVFQLGRMYIDVTDSTGNPIEDPEARQLKITVIDSGKLIRTASQISNAEFDLLPGSKYKVFVSYTVGGEIQKTEFQEAITIEEGNHKNISIPLPIGAISGKVVNMAGRPAQNVEVILNPTMDGVEGAAIDSAESSQKAQKTVTTDENGVYLFPDLGIGMYELILNKPRYKREKRKVSVVGGTISNVEDVQLFHGIEVAVTGVSRVIIDDADVKIVNKATSTQIPIVRYKDIYRNKIFIPKGDYIVSVDKAGYESASREISIQDTDPSLEVSFQLPYYITVKGSIVNGKGALLPDTMIEFQDQHSELPLQPEVERGEPSALSLDSSSEFPLEGSEKPSQAIITPDGTFNVKLLVTGAGDERIKLRWKDNYNQDYSKTVTFPLPSEPQTVTLGKIRLPVNFLRLAISDVLGYGVTADKVTMFHEESGQSGIHMALLKNGVYESTNLLNGNYTIRIVKDGYQDVEQNITISGGTMIEIPITLYNYVTVTGTVVNGKNDRIAGASIKFQGLNSELTSFQPIVTGKDGRFQTTLLVKKAEKENVEVTWKSPDSGRRYHIKTEFELPGIPIADLYPMDLGEYQLPANFLSVEVQDISGRGLAGVDVTFISNQGATIPGSELGEGIYESSDLQNGYYDISIAKEGYKENFLIPDVAVGKDLRKVHTGPIILPHYVAVTGTILNGKDEGIPNVEVLFEGKQSEQLEKCRTDRQGRFTTTLLATGTAEENWQAIWKREEYGISSSFALPVHPGNSVNLGEIHLPVNFVSLPIENILGKPLSGVSVEVAYIDGTPIDLEEFALEEVEPGIYQAQNLPDGMYTFSLQKDGYEIGKSVDVTVKGGKHSVLKSIQLGHYVTLTGTAVNGKQKPVTDATVTFSELCSTLLHPEPEEGAQEQEIMEEEEAFPDTQTSDLEPSVVTDTEGKFTAKLLVNTPGIDQVVVTWGKERSSSYPLNLLGTPGSQHIGLHLPINFIQVHVTDVSGKPLSEASVTLTHRVEKTIFPAKEVKEGLYETQGLPDGNYAVFVGKDRYESQTETINVQDGEIQHISYRLNHYVTVKGYVINGKNEGVAAATVHFKNLKTKVMEKAISGTDGVFEAEILVKDTGRELGEITWVGEHGTYTKQFWVELPTKPALITLPQDETRLPSNFVSLEVKSVAATGVSGATITFTHQKTGQVVEARDLDKGNYEGEDLPDGTYDISIIKEKYKAITIKDVAVENGEHKIDVQVPNFLHYMTISGVVRNGKRDGVSEAVVMVKNPKRLQETEAVSTREDGSFTLNALVTDVGTETISVVWHNIYAVTLPVTLPSVPEHIQLNNIVLPINFITVNVQDIFGKNISGAALTFLEKDQETSNLQISIPQSPTPRSQIPKTFTGIEVSNGVYESPELPDGEYIIITRKDNYMQQDYPIVAVKSGITVSDVKINLPHLVTVKGTVTDGKNTEVPGAKVQFGGQNSKMGSHQVYTNTSGYFSERLQVTGTEKETIIITVSGPPYTYTPEEQFKFTQEFDLLTKPGEQELNDLRLPINFIPIRIQDVSGNEIGDAHVTLTRMTPDEEQETKERTQKPGLQWLSSFDARPLPTFSALNLGQGKYEGQNLKDGTYKISISKEGYEKQERTVSIVSGETAPEMVFILPHYVRVSGMATNGKGNGVPGAILEFDPQNSTVVECRVSNTYHQSSIRTDARGHFSACLLVKKTGTQRVRAVWKERYVKQLSFQLPEQPDMHYTLEEDVRLPINFAPVRVTNVLSEGLAGVEITLRKTGRSEEDSIRFHSLGEGFYEATELPDGVYAMTIHKEGYQDVTENISVHGGEQSAEQQFSLPHFVTVRGTVINGKGIGVAGATISLTGLNSQLIEPDTQITTGTDGSFQIDLLVTGAGNTDLREHIEISWETTSSFIGAGKGGVPFGISQDFYLPATPRSKNLGLLSLPANFASVSVQDVSGKGLSGVKVSFLDEHGREFQAKEFAGGFYEGQNLPDGTYTVSIFKEGYKEDNKTELQIGASPEKHETENPESEIFDSTQNRHLTFRLPYYVQLTGKTVDGKGQEIASNISLELAGSHSELLPETVVFDQDGDFRATLMVNTSGREQLHIVYVGEHGQHARQVSFVLPPVPEVVDLHRIALPVNFIPIEVRDLMGHGLTDSTVTLHHIKSGEAIMAKELGNGQYEGENLLDGSYRITVAKEGYKSIENPMVTVAGGIVSETKSFRLRHYVWIAGIAMNGEGEGVRDPVIQVERLRSLDIQKQSDITGKFEVKLEVREIGNEKMSLEWKNMYRTPIIFKLPSHPERKNLGEIRLPVNFLSILVTDISGSTLRDVDVTVEDAEGVVQSLKTDQNGSCKTSDLQNGLYKVSAKTPGYKLESREVYVSDGKVTPVKFTLPHYVVIRGEVKDIRQNPVGGVAVIFEEFTDAGGQKLRTNTEMSHGRFEQKLLIDDPKFLVRQRGHFRIKKGNMERLFTFKIPAEPDQVSHYKTLLFPTNYLLGKVVDADVRTIPIHEANVSLALIAERPAVRVAQQTLPDQSGEMPNSQNTLRFTTDSLGGFEAGNLQEGEYKITIQKEGYVTHEDFVHISGLLQEQEFTLRKE